MNSIRKLLVVEDDQADQFFFRRAMQSEAPGVEIEFVDDAEAALDWLDHAPALPGLIVTDLAMPGMGGMKLLERLKSDSRFRRIPAVVFSTSNASSDINNAYDRCCSTYVVKPGEAKGYREIAGLIKNYWFEKAALPV